MSNSRSLSIRRAAPADAALLAKLGATTFTEAFGASYAPEDLATFLRTARTPDAYAAVLRDPTVAVWLAQAGIEEPVGFAVAGPCKLPVPRLESSAGEIRELYVLSMHHGGGLGSRLLTMALDWLESERRLPIYVGVWSQNHGAQRLYARHGFEKVGEYDFPVGRHLDREFILKRR